MQCLNCGEMCSKTENVWRCKNCDFAKPEIPCPHFDFRMIEVCGVKYWECIFCLSTGVIKQ